MQSLNGTIFRTLLCFLEPCVSCCSLLSLLGLCYPLLLFFLVIKILLCCPLRLLRSCYFLSFLAFPYISLVGLTRIESCLVFEQYTAWFTQSHLQVECSVTLVSSIVVK